MTSKEKRRLPEADLYTLTDLDQIKVLADPLRIKILEGFCEERTTKQVAGLLEEKPTRLYHHVDALERVGLIRQTRTRQVRGTLEKYYLAVAKKFRAGARIFAGREPSSEEIETLRSVVSTIFDNTESELHRLIDSGASLADIEEEGVLGFVEVQTGEARIQELRKQVKALIEAEQDDEVRDDEPKRRFRLTLAFYPLDRQKTE